MRDRDRPEDAAPLIGTYGFLLRSKSFEVLFDAVAILRRRIPGARLRMVTASYGDESELLARALRRRAIDLELEDAIEWHTAFLPRAESLRLLGGCDVIALPYGPTAESSSAALRTAMAAGRPVAVTPVAIFEEARGAVATLPGGTPEAIADGLAALLDDPARRAALARSGADWLAGRDWARIAERTFGMLDGLLGARRAEVAAPRAGRQCGNASALMVRWVGENASRTVRKPASTSAIRISWARSRSKRASRISTVPPRASAVAAWRSTRAGLAGRTLGHQDEVGRTRDDPPARAGTLGVTTFGRHQLGEQPAPRPAPGHGGRRDPPRDRSDCRTAPRRCAGHGRGDAAEAARRRRSA